MVKICQHDSPVSKSPQSGQHLHPVGWYSLFYLHPDRFKALSAFMKFLATMPCYGCGCRNESQIKWDEPQFEERKARCDENPTK